VSGSHGSSSTFTYDTLGDQTQVATATATTYGYDQAAQMTTATTPAGETSFLYNGDGLVAAETTGATTSEYTWDTNVALPLLLSDGANDYVYGPDGTPVEQVDLATSTPTYMTYSPADSTWLTSNAAGEETGFWGYDSFGTLAFGTPTSTFGYAGQSTDATTGLSDMRARWYEPGIGEFTSVDPDLAETGQPYQYAGDDPVNENDPSGLNDCGVLSFVCDVGHVVAGGARFAYEAQLETGRIGANFLVGATNAIDTLVPNGIQAPAPFCGTGLGVAYNVGVIAGGVGISALGVLGVTEEEAASIVGEEATDAGVGALQFEVSKEAAPWPGTSVPQSFDLSVGGETYTVVPNATEHMAEYATSTGSGTFPISSLASAVEEAQGIGLHFGRNFLTVGNWELGIDTSDNVIYHALYGP
jgi:RHS repeat-associated protein